MLKFPTANKLHEQWKLDVLSTSRPHRARSMEQQTVYWKQGEPWLACCSRWPAASSLERQHSCPRVFQDPPFPITDKALLSQHDGSAGQYDISAAEHAYPTLLCSVSQLGH